MEKNRALNHSPNLFDAPGTEASASEILATKSKVPGFETTKLMRVLYQYTTRVEVSRSTRRLLE